MVQGLAVPCQTHNHLHFRVGELPAHALMQGIPQADCAEWCATIPSPLRYRGPDRGPAGGRPEWCATHFSMRAERISGAVPFVRPLTMSGECGQSTNTATTDTLHSNPVAGEWKRIGRQSASMSYPPLCPGYRRVTVMFCHIVTLPVSQMLRQGQATSLPNSIVERAHRGVHRPVAQCFSRTSLMGRERRPRSLVPCTSNAGRV
jgi:hypothetical protein